MNKFQAGTILTCQVMDYQVYAIGKAIRLLITDLVTYTCKAECKVVDKKRNVTNIVVF